VMIVARGSARLSLVRFDAAFWLAAVLRLTRHDAGSLGFGYVRCRSVVVIWLSFSAFQAVWPDPRRGS